MFWQLFTGVPVQPIVPFENSEYFVCASAESWNITQCTKLGERRLWWNYPRRARRGWGKASRLSQERSCSL